MEVTYMKKVYLKAWVENLLTGVSIIQVMIMMMFNDFSFKAIPFITLFIGLLLFNIYTLNKYGRKFRRN